MRTSCAFAGFSTSTTACPAPPKRSRSHVSASTQRSSFASVPSAASSPASCSTTMPRALCTLTRIRSLISTGLPLRHTTCVLWLFAPPVSSPPTVASVICVRERPR